VKVLMVGLATFDQMAGGSARYLSGLAESMQALGHDVQVVTAATHVRASGYSERGLLGQIARSLRRLVLVIPGSFLTVLRSRPDTVNVHFALDGVGAVLGAVVTGARVVVNFQGPWAAEAVATGVRGRWRLSTWVRRAIESWVYRRADACIVLSTAFRDLLVASYGVPMSRVTVIPPGIDHARFALPPGVDRSAQPFTIVTVRRLVPRMGLDIAIEALALMPTDLKARLFIAGIGPERQRLERLARQRGLEDRVALLGRVPDDELSGLYHQADACIVPSRELEGFGYVALEALAAGVPVIASATGGLVDLLEPLEPRWLCPPDASQFAQRLTELAEDAGRFPSRTQCSAYATHFDWPEISGRVASVLFADHGP
jgi:glycosyltransferase involved in cell wall biosynthesis